MTKLTEEQAYQAMRLFLERNWRRSESMDVAQLLSDTDTEIWADGGSGDPAAKAEWHECVQEVLEGKRAAAE